VLLPPPHAVKDPIAVAIASQFILPVVLCIWIS
jgi:hypothetical protein